MRDYKKELDAIKIERFDLREQIKQLKLLYQSEVNKRKAYYAKMVKLKQDIRAIIYNIKDEEE